MFNRSVTATSGYDIKLNLGNSSQFTLNTSTVYTFSVAVSTVNETTGAIFQLHSQRNTIALSYSVYFNYTQTMQGTDVGLYVAVDSTKNVNFYANISCSLFCNGTQESVLVLAAVTPLVSDREFFGKRVTWEK